MAKNIAINKTDGIVKKQFRLFYYCINIQYLLYEITSSADFRFSPEAVGGVSHYDVENDSFLIGNMQ